MNKKLYVGNLPYRATDTDLQELFGSAGQVESVTIITDRYTGRSKGFAFVEMASEDEARQAIETLNGREMDGRNLTVAEAHPPRTDRGGDRDRRRRDDW